MTVTTEPTTEPPSEPELTETIIPPTEFSCLTDPGPSITPELPFYEYLTTEVPTTNSDSSTTFETFSTPEPTSSELSTAEVSATELYPWTDHYTRTNQ